MLASEEGVAIGIDVGALVPTIDGRVVGAVVDVIVGRVADEGAVPFPALGCVVF